MTLGKVNALGFVCWCWATSGWAQTLEIKNAWIRLAPPGASNYAAYMQLQNSSQQDVAIVSLSADCCAMAMFHRSARSGDRVSMESMALPNLAAGASLELSPGGMHLMLMHPKKNLFEGERVRIHLEFSSGEAQTIWLPVLRQSPNVND